MLSNVEVLDCTLRDGGRIINCEFGSDDIRSIVSDLTVSNIDYIELGFIRNKIQYKYGSTFFTSIDQVKEFVKDNANSKYLLFVDYNMYDIAQIPDRSNNEYIYGIRLGFKKGELHDAVIEASELKRKGYHVFMQDVDTLGYSKAEIIEMIDIINEIEPYSFAIVDTYGAIEDASRIEEYFILFNSSLKPSIAIDFHSHNNYQLSFALAQRVLKLAQTNPGRKVIIDGTLYGMGKVAGNLNIELLVDYLTKVYKETRYNLNVLFDCIDETILPYYRNAYWGYSTSSLLSGKYKVHPNNVIYLQEKYKLDTNDLEKILAMLGESKRKSYDYDYIEQCYIEYNALTKSKDSSESHLREVLKGKKVIVIAPGSNIKKYKATIDQFIEEMNPEIVSINFVFPCKRRNYAFFANVKRYKKIKNIPPDTQVILSSNVKTCHGNEMYIDYKKLIRQGWKNFDNATIMLLRFLADTDVSDVFLAGFDGFKGANDFYESNMAKNVVDDVKESVNKEIKEMLYQVKQQLNDQGINMVFITPSQFEEV